MGLIGPRADQTHDPPCKIPGEPMIRPVNEEAATKRVGLVHGNDPALEQKSKIGCVKLLADFWLTGPLLMN